MWSDHQERRLRGTGYGMSKEEIRQMGENAKAYYMKYFEKEMVIDRVNEILNRK